jgi:hypothetical protein
VRDAGGRRGNERVFVFRPFGRFFWSVAAVTMFGYMLKGGRAKFHACLNTKTQPFFRQVTFSSSLISFNLFSSLPFFVSRLSRASRALARIELKFITL